LHYLTSFISKKTKIKQQESTKEDHMYNTLSLLHHNIKPHFDILKHLWAKLLNWSYLFQPRINNTTNNTPPTPTTPMLPRAGISSHSLGRAWVHNLPEKLDAAAKYNMDIELFYEDLLYVAKSLPGGATPSNHLIAAQQIRSMCDDRDLQILCLQPFMHYEGLRDRAWHAERVEEMKTWIQMAHILGTNIIVIPSTFLPADVTSGDLELITADMREVADMGAPEGITFAYENLSWGTWVDTWEQAWEVVQLVDRENFGICLDTFNIAARIYADPESGNRKTADADAVFKASMDRLVKTVDPKKIVFVQVVDGEYLSEPLVEGHKWYNAAQPARMSWSRNCRLFYGESDRGAYLPVRQVLEAILIGLGWRGRISHELFSASLVEEDAGVPEEHARRAAVGWEKLLSDMGMGAQKRRASLMQPEQAARL
jgi:4-hydroxyphenylpyruvate dioxygenase